MTTDDELRAECEKIIADAARYNISRSCSEGAYTWGEWIDAAQAALDCDDFSEYRWMCDQPDTTEYDDDGYSDYLYDMRRDEQMVRAYERELCA
jgi:hypothetical protein